MNEELDLEKIISLWVEEARVNMTEDEDPRVGQNVSTLPELKITFEGFGETEHHGEDRDKESYAVYIHKRALEPNFVFPDHQENGLTVTHRPDDEICHFLWYDRASSEFYGSSLIESIQTSNLSYDEIKVVIEGLHASRTKLAEKPGTSKPPATVISGDALKQKLKKSGLF